jgi:hypothetical protein
MYIPFSHFVTFHPHAACVCLGRGKFLFVCVQAKAEKSAVGRILMIKRESLCSFEKNKGIVSQDRLLLLLLCISHHQKMKRTQRYTTAGYIVFREGHVALNTKVEVTVLKE